MTLELHVWAPAFGLPSIDAECLAAIAYLALAVPKQRTDSSTEQWVIIPDAEIATVPTNEFPALRDVSGHWVSGFRNIVQYLQQFSNGQWDLDSWMNNEERADCIAYSSFIKTHASRLTDLSLYVSSENYDGATQPEIFRTLNYWPNTWIIPRQMRDHAKARTAHLGLSGLDLNDALKESRKDTREAIIESQIPNSLKVTPKESISDMLSRGATVSPTRIQLDSMVDKLVKPLHALLNCSHSKTYLIGDGSQPTSADCIALGYFGLALIPKLPSPWLRETVAEKSDPLVTYIKNLQISCFGEEAYTMESLSLQNDQSHSTQQQEGQQQATYKLPMRLSTPPPALRTIASTIVDSLLDNLPFISTSMRTRRSIRQPSRPSSSASSSDGTETPQLAVAMAQARRQERLATWGTFALGGAAFIGYLVSTGIVRISLGKWGEDETLESEEGEQEEGTFDPGEAGQLLGL